MTAKRYILVEVVADCLDGGDTAWCSGLCEGCMAPENYGWRADFTTAVYANPAERSANRQWWTTGSR